MSDILYIQRGELTATEIVDEVDTGNRVVIEVDLLGTSVRMAIRKRSETYYCDTPVKLLKYRSPEEMRSCLERYKLATPEREPDVADGLEVS